MKPTRFDLQTLQAHCARCILHVIAVFVCAACVAPAFAQEEFAPPKGSGPVIVLVSGSSGPSHYRDFAKDIAKLGYDVVLFDSNPMKGTHGAALRSAIVQAQGMPHALPGKVGLVGCSLGGGMALDFGSKMGDLAVVDVDWYPLTSTIKDIPGLVSGFQMPVMMFAGVDDTYKDCCLVSTAQAIQAEATTEKANYQLFTYPGVQHDFVIGGQHYDKTAYKDAFSHMSAFLAQYLPLPAAK